MDNKEEFVKDESVIGEENEDQIQKERGLLTDEEYMSLGKYDFDLFTVEDYREYHDILIEMPYNWELMKFFHKAYIDEYRTTYRARKYEADAISIDELSPYLTDGSNPLKRMISRADSDELWIRIIASVNLDDLFNVIAHRVYRKSQRAIAKLKGKNEVTISRSISRCEYVIHSIALQMLMEKKLDGFVLNKDEMKGNTQL